MSYKTIHVDSNSKEDEENGSFSSPFKTLQKAFDEAGKISETPKILLKADSWFSRGIIDRYGSESEPVIIGKYGSGKNPVIGGGYRVKKNTWEQKESFGTNLYRQQTDSVVNGVYMDGKDLKRSAYENRWINIDSYDEGNQTIEASSINITDKDRLIGATMRIKIKLYAEQADIKIVDWDSDTNKLTLDRQLQFDINKDKIGGKLPQKFRLENKQGGNFMTKDGDWCCVPNGDKFFVYLYSTSNPDNRDIVFALGGDNNNNGDLLTLKGNPDGLKINNIRFTLAGRNAINYSEKKPGLSNIIIGSGCSFDRIVKAGVYLYPEFGSKYPAENIKIGDADAYMKFRQCGIMVLINSPLNPEITHLEGKQIGMTGSEFNDKQNAGVFFQLNGAIVTTGYIEPVKDGIPKPAGGTINNIKLDTIGANGIAHEGFGTKIHNIEGTNFNQRLDDIALVYTFSRPNQDQPERTSNIEIYEVNGTGSSDVYEGWEYGNEERLRAVVYVDNGVNDSIVRDVYAKDCFKGIFVNFFTRNNQVFDNEVVDCDQSIFLEARPDENGDTIMGHNINNNTVRLASETQFAFGFRSDDNVDVDYGEWKNNTIYAVVSNQPTILLKKDKKKFEKTVEQFQNEFFGEGNTQQFVSEYRHLMDLNAMNFSN